MAPQAGFEPAILRLTGGKDVGKGKKRATSQVGSEPEQPRARTPEHFRPLLGIADAQHPTCLKSATSETSWPGFAAEDRNRRISFTFS